MWRYAIYSSEDLEWRKFVFIYNTYFVLYRKMNQIILVSFLIQTHFCITCPFIVKFSSMQLYKRPGIAL